MVVGVGWEDVCDIGLFVCGLLAGSISVVLASADIHVIAHLHITKPYVPISIAHTIHITIIPIPFGITIIPVRIIPLTLIILTLTRILLRHNKTIQWIDPNLKITAISTAAIILYIIKR